MRPEVEPTEANRALWQAVAETLRAVPAFPRELSWLRRVAVVQVHPAMLRLVLVGMDAGPLEVARISGAALPSTFGDAAETVFTAGLNGLTLTDAEEAFEHASHEGAGLMLVLDLETGLVRGVVGADVGLADELFGIAPQAETCH